MKIIKKENILFFFVKHFYGLSTSEGKFLRLKLRIQCALLIQKKINAYSDGDILTYCSLSSSYLFFVCASFDSNIQLI